MHNLLLLLLEMLGCFNPNLGKIWTRKKI